MCGRYTLTRFDRIVDDLEAALGEVAQHELWRPRFNIAPTQPAPVVVAHGGARQVAMMRWGLVPHWAAGARAGDKRAPLLINARAESIEERPMFRDAARRRRCLVPADGFFEWQKRPEDPKHPQPIYLRPASPALIAFAGLWARAKAADGSEQLSFAIITGPPNELVAPIHDRMPVVLDPASYGAWLDPLVDGEAAQALLQVPAVGDWRGIPVSPHVNKATHDDPECIEPIEPGAPAKQLSLF